MFLVCGRVRASRGEYTAACGCGTKGSPQPSGTRGSLGWGPPARSPGGAGAQGGFWLGMAPVCSVLCSLGACRSFAFECRGTAALMWFVNHVQHSVEI